MAINKNDVDMYVQTMCIISGCDKKEEGWIDTGIKDLQIPFVRLHYCKEHFDKIMARGDELNKAADARAKARGAVAGFIGFIPEAEINKLGLSLKGDKEIAQGIKAMLAAIKVGK